MKGWFQVPGLRPEGDRTIAEQMIGLTNALSEAPGKTVLDLGCAEGAISLAFAEAGAAEVVGIEALETHLEIARKFCANAPNVRFVQALLQEWIPVHEPPERYDIVLILGIIHKLRDPEIPLRWAARSAKDLLLFRGPGRNKLKGWDGTIRAKHSKAAVNVPVVLRSEGFKLERQISGVRGEGVHYWRRA